MLWLLLPAALAQDPVRYPLMTEVPLAPEAGDQVLRIPVPLALRTPADPPLATDLLLTDAEGRRIPVAVARGEGELEREILTVWPERNDRAWVIQETERPIDGLLVELGGQPALATVLVEAQVGGSWVPWGEPQQVWQHEYGDHLRVDLPPTKGPLRVRTEQELGWSWWRRTEINGFRLKDAAVPSIELTLPVTATQHEEGGWTRYVVPLPSPLPISSITLHPEGDLFQRAVQVRSKPREERESIHALQTIHRVAIDGATLDLTTVPPELYSGGDQLVIYVGDGGSAPLVIPEVTVQVEGLELLAREVGPGPLRLYGGAEPGTNAVSDLQLGAPELSRLVWGALEPGSVEANPAWLPPEERAGLAGPGPEVDASRYTFRLPVDGGPGLSRIPLSEELLGRVNPATAELRLLTADGRQVPLLVRRAATDHPWGSLPFTREEEGSTSRLRVKIPSPAVPVAGVTLQTEAPVFNREVGLYRVQGPVLDPLRRFQWRGADRPLTAALHLNQVVGDELIVQIDNGDDPPLPITAVSASWPGWEIIAVLPDEPVWLMGGAEQPARPRYDLALLEAELQRRATTGATLGPIEELSPLPPSSLDRGLLFGGIGILALGLGGLTLRLLGGLPAEEEEAETDPEARAEAPDPDDETPA